MSARSRAASAARSVCFKAFPGPVLWGLLFSLLFTQAAWACAMAWKHQAYAEITREEAIIIWDERQKIEHFIRRAQFQGSAQELGFLVPTPSRPELGEVPDRAFAPWLQAVQPQIQTRIELVPTLIQAILLPQFTASEKQALNALARVELGPEQDLGSYTAQILRSAEPQALQDWLKAHGYESDQALLDWLRPYAQSGWFVTAFRVKPSAKEAADSSLESASAAAEINANAELQELELPAVRLSFKTETPFYPYTEPQRERASGAPRMLRLYTLASAPKVGIYGSEAESDRAQPLGFDGLHGVQGRRMNLHTAPTPQAQKLLESVLPDSQLKVDGWWLSAWSDFSQTRPGPQDVVAELFIQSTSEDHFFRPTRTRKKVWFFPFDIALLLGWLIWRIRRYKRRKAQS